MAYTAPAKDTVHFVGGLGNQLGRHGNNGGGCTKVAWDAGVPLDFMVSDGGPIANANNCVYTHATTQIGKTGIGAISTEGTLVYVIKTAGAGNLTTGKYEITDIIDAHNIEVANIDADGDCTVTIRIGGAIDSLQNALDNDSTDAALYTRSIYTNLAESVALPIDIDTGEGTPANDTWKRIIGCSSTMVPITTRGSYLVIAASGDESIFLINGIDNVYIQSIETQPGIDGFGVESVESGVGGANFYNTVLRNCKITGGDGSIHQNLMRGLTLVECVLSLPSSTMHFMASTAFFTTFINCEIEVSASQLGINWAGNRSLIMAGCTIKGGSYSNLQSGSSSTLVVFINCTYYNQSGDVFLLNSNVIGFIGYNNVYMLGDNAAGIRALEYAAGSVIFNDYNCAYSDAGALDTTPYDNPSAQYHNLNSIEADPLMVNPGSDDYRLDNGSPCLNTGILPVGTGGKTTMGTFQRMNTNRPSVVIQGA